MDPTGIEKEAEKKNKFMAGSTNQAGDEGGSSDKTSGPNFGANGDFITILPGPECVAITINGYLEEEYCEDLDEAFENSLENICREISGEERNDMGINAIQLGDLFEQFEPNVGQWQINGIYSVFSFMCPLVLIFMWLTMVVIIFMVFQSTLFDIE